MSNRAPATLLLSAGAIMLAVAGLGDRLLSALGLFSGDAGGERIGATATALLAGGGFLVLVLGLVVMYRSHLRVERAAPYVLALRPFAAEFGRGVEQDGDALWVEAQRDAVRIRIALDARPGGRVEVRSVAPARQSLAWVRRGGAPEGDAAAWREAEVSLHWQMRAELPAMARPLLEDRALMNEIDRFFADPHGESVVHSIAGLVIRAATPPAAQAADFTRLCAEIAFRLRRING
jgi:hypothetical protein